MTPDNPHVYVGAYILGVLDDEDLAWFPAHLAGCDLCEELATGLSPVEQMLAALGPAISPPGGPPRRKAPRAPTSQSTREAAPK
ncbi:zf-HC2 domain-containing protein [Streptomyces sp. NPDC051219]|uniref:zf-HC2 domain-containing protein n=1 Tax=Streptomyces sp. NPDC051219 TaxID=3155283 RepID=UPI00342C7F28